MAEGGTCGAGLAEHSPLHLKLGELSDSMAENLELHMKALDFDDEAAKVEHRAYSRLVEEHRRIAAELRATGDEMAGYRELPMGRHDQNALSSPEVVAAFEKLVRVEREALALLQKRVREHEEMLAAIGEADPI